MLIQKTKTKGRYQARQNSPESDGILRMSWIGFGDTHYEAIQKCLNKMFNLTENIYPDSFISEQEQQIYGF